MLLDYTKMKMKELFPELKEDDSVDAYIELLPGTELKEYTRACLKKSGYVPTKQDSVFLEILCDISISMGQIKAMFNSEGKIIYQVGNILATQMVAGILRNTYYNPEKPITSLVKPREELYNLGKEESTFSTGMSLNDETLQQIFQCIEAQKGAFTPIETLAPIKSSPQDDFARAVYILENMERWMNNGN